MSDYQYLSIKQIAESNQYPFSLGQIRHYLIMRHKNGEVVGFDWTGFNEINVVVYPFFPCF